MVQCGSRRRRWGNGSGARSSTGAQASTTHETSWACLSATFKEKTILSASPANQLLFGFVIHWWLHWWMWIGKRKPNKLLVWVTSSQITVGETSESSNIVKTPCHHAFVFKPWDITKSKNVTKTYVLSYPDKLKNTARPNIWRDLDTPIRSAVISLSKICRASHKPWFWMVGRCRQEATQAGHRISWPTNHFDPCRLGLPIFHFMHQ